MKIASDFFALIKKHLATHYTADQLAQFDHYLTLMTKWNKTYNLTAITDPVKMVTQHILDSLSINSFLRGTRICDVGTGAGLPAIPLAIANPDKQFTLIDANAKKTKFLTQTKIELNLTNIEIIHARVEQFEPDICFNTVVSRAFSTINIMLSKAQHLCCKDGIFLSMKGQYPETELATLNKNFQIKFIEKLKIPDLNAQRHVVCITKLD